MEDRGTTNRKQTHKHDNPNEEQIILFFRHNSDNFRIKSKMHQTNLINLTHTRLRST